MFIGGGGSIPFMEVFSGLFPKANFLLTGCCFTESNAHSANENLDLEFCRKLTTVISKLLSEL
jgi:acetylornithine deacetylase/succinyl-diaminopimelate desuccinylase-like protein